MIHLKFHDREAEELLRDLDRRKDELLDGLLMQLAEKLRKAMKPKRKDKKPYDANEERALVAKFGRKWSRKPSKAEKRESRASIREKCVARANGICECGCGGRLTDPANGDFAGLANSGRPVLDHMFGRGKGRRPEALETCWILRWDCNEARTHNQPDAVTWWKRYLFHCEVHGYAVEAKAARDMIYKLETKATLPAAPRTGGRTDG